MFADLSVMEGENQVKFEDFTKLTQFRALSELGKEAKGGYIDGSIYIPYGTSKFTLGLYDKNDLKIHPNFLYINPHKGKRQNDKFDINCHNLTFILHENELILDLSNHQYLNPEEAKFSFNSEPFWDPENRKLMLGQGKLQLTIVKVGQKGESKLSLKKVKEARGESLAQDPDFTQVLLGVQIEDLVYLSPMMICDKVVNYF